MNERVNGLTVDTVRGLMTECEGICVSIYLPTEKAGSDTIQNAIRFKNTLRTVGRKLEKEGMRSFEVDKMLAPAVRQLDDERFWQHQEHGLAVFINGTTFRQIKLPVQVDELVVVTDRFHIKPLLPLLASDDRFFLLAISQGHVSLHRGDRYNFEEVEVEKLPANMDEALRYDDSERQLQFHTGTTAPGRGGRQAIFHGHSSATDKNVKDDVRRYCHVVDQQIKKHLSEERAPLILAAVEPVASIYRECNTYPHLLESAIHQNTQRLNRKELHAEAWKLIEPFLEQAVHDAMTRFNEFRATDRAETNLKEVLRAAQQGRVETLFVALGIQQWGTFAQDTGKSNLYDEPANGREDMLDLAAIMTYTNGGQVFAVRPEQVPNGGPLAAIYRY